MLFQVKVNLLPLKSLLMNVSRKIWPDTDHNYKKYKYKIINNNQRQSKLMEDQYNKSQYKTTTITNYKAVYQLVVIKVLIS